METEVIRKVVMCFDWYYWLVISPWYSIKHALNYS